MFTSSDSKNSRLILLGVAIALASSQQAYADLSGFNLFPSLTVSAADSNGQIISNMSLYESLFPTTLDFGESVELTPTSSSINPAIATSTVTTVNNVRTIVYSITAIGDNGFGTPDAYMVPDDAFSTGWRFSYRQSGLTIDPDQISTVTKFNEVLGVNGETLREFSFAPGDIGSTIAPSWSLLSSGTANPFGPDWNGGTPAEIRSTYTYTVVPSPSGVALLAFAGIVCSPRRR